MNANEAAERLRKAYKHDGRVGPWVDAALADERRHVIEQIRERLDELDLMAGDSYNAILDDLSTPEQKR